jgi:CheY-like chemotaxis protein
MATVVVCDDDTVVRTAVSAVCATAGLEVVAETDNSNDAVEMVRRFGVDVLVLDLSLVDGSGEQTLTALAAEGSHTAVVVFTAYASDPSRLLALGAREVVEKPEFEQLGAVLASLATSLDHAVHPENRRLASREVEAPPKLWRSPSGVSSRQDLAYSLLQMEPGDAALGVTVVGLDSLEADVGPLLVADCRLAVAALLHQELRVQDLLHEAPEVGGVIALLRGGDARAAGAVWSRLSVAVREAGLPGEVKGAASRIDGIGAKDAVSRAIAALQPAAVGGSPFLSV